MSSLNSTQLLRCDEWVSRITYSYKPEKWLTHFKYRRSTVEVVVPNILDELELFNRIFTALYVRQQADAIALLAGLERRRRQYNLLAHQDLFYILSEVYPRATHYIKQGNSIRNHYAFIRLLGLRVIQECSRANCRSRDRFQSIEDTTTAQEASLAVEPLISDFELMVKLERLFAAMERLSDRDRQIIHLRYWQRKSWEEIAACLIPATMTDRGIATMRQAGHRALRRLRRLMQETPE
jgi:DNA-directed RNA polymerase specialized sigma24 family protein